MIQHSTPFISSVKASSSDSTSYRQDTIRGNIFAGDETLDFRSYQVTVVAAEVDITGSFQEFCDNLRKSPVHQQYLGKIEAFSKEDANVMKAFEALHSELVITGERSLFKVHAIKAEILKRYIFNSHDFMVPLDMIIQFVLFPDVNSHMDAISYSSPSSRS
jgi:hypothetical protein